MAIAEIKVPQLGEGLKEVLIRELLKKPGELVRRDEPIYVVETEKALVDAESPVDGILAEWLARVDDIVAIGSPVARILTQNAGAMQLPVSNSGEGNNSVGDRELSPMLEPDATSARIIPPRTRAYCRQLGLHASDFERIAAPTGKLMPADVDVYLAATRPSPASESSPTISERSTSSTYTERGLSAPQRTLMFRLTRSSRIVVPGHIARSLDWQRVVDRAKDLEKTGTPASPFQVFAYCLAQASKAHPKFRSTLVRNSDVREYRHLNLGIAIARPDDELVTAVVPEADRLGLDGFVDCLQRQIRRAWKGGDQATEATQLILSYLGSQYITDAVPTLVAPASAVVFVGSSYKQGGTLMAKVAITFDHRLINGVGAARFLNCIDQEMALLQLQLHSPELS